MSGTSILKRRQLRTAAFVALQRALLGADIDTPGDWVTQPENMPSVLLRASRTNKEPLIAGQPEYTTTIVLEIESRAVGLDASAAQDAIDALDMSIECALLTNDAFVSLTQRTYIDTETEINSEGRNHFGGTKWVIRCECVEVFDPFSDAPDCLQPVAPPLDGLDLQVDLVGTFDPSGVYPAGVFADAVLPAPRASGPDGRDEGGITINFPQ